ncbi:AbrB/MazE/SpoVT family DNA-binding domain-containing protein [Candidatus Bathyarchaeota archaeon]|nr:AbrB/MazE/SpoVT family DNA-binding domain-containing protein [Candidatus Bathyarchaeota archaeon]
MAVSKVSKKGLTNVPVRVRRALGVEEGDMLLWEVDENLKVVRVKVLKNPIRALVGKYRDVGLTYENVEEKADRLLAGELNASDRA